MIVIYNVNGLETKGYYVKFKVASATWVLFATGRFLLHSQPGFDNHRQKIQNPSGLPKVHETMGEAPKESGRVGPSQQAAFENPKSDIEVLPSEQYIQPPLAA